VLAAFLLYGVGSATAHRPTGMALVIANSLAVSCAGLIGFRLLRRSDWAVALLYFAARVAEAALLAGGIVLAQHADLGDADVAGYLLAMSVLGAASNPFLQSLGRRRLLPRSLATWGVVGYAALSAGALVELTTGRSVAVVAPALVVAGRRRVTNRTGLLGSRPKPESSGGQGRMSISSEKYVALTTYRKNGESSSTPVWIADLGDGSLGFTTSGSSLKAKRIGNDRRIQLQACDSRGRVKDGSEPINGTAVVASGPDFDRVRARIKAKYGWQVSLIGLLAKAAKLVGKDQTSDHAILITLD